VSAGWRAVQDLVDDAVASGVFPSASLVVGSADDVLFEHVAGRPARDSSSRADIDTVYDLSSLTKPLATVAALLLLCERGRVGADARIGDYFSELVPHGTGRASLTVRDVLYHRSGLPAHRRYYEKLGQVRREGAAKLVGTRAGSQRVQAYAAVEPLERPPRTEAVYSDVGFILLGGIVEKVAQRTLDRVFAEEIAAPLGLRSTGFIDLEAAPPPFAERAAACGWCEWRERRVRGQVQDENAWAMGGVAGHAGLFSTAREVHRLTAEHVRAWQGLPSLFDTDTLKQFWRRDEHTPGSTWMAGWDTPSPEQSSAGSLIGRPAAGHLGFTGTSLWIDLHRGIHVVLLTNRLEFGRDNAKIRAFRPRLHDAVFATADAAKH
jgi:CubicO group peptidase (beta-lactamase class C family)